jgi:hypothetical protein
MILKCSLPDSLEMLGALRRGTAPIVCELVCQHLLRLDSVVGDRILRRSVTMASDKQCEDYARECATIAGLTNDKAVRDQMLKMACRWMEAAAHERFARVVRASFSRRPH